MFTHHWYFLVTYHLDVVGCFIWDLIETSLRLTNGKPLLRPLEASSRRSDKTLWRRTTETSWQGSIETLLNVSFETYLQRCWGVQRDVVTTSPRRLVAGWDCHKSCTINNFYFVRYSDNVFIIIFILSIFVTFFLL